MTANDDSNTSGARWADGSWSGAWPRYLNALIAVWLFISAFAWTHTTAQRGNTWIVALFMFVTALAALVVRGFRWVNTVLAAWLFLSTLALPYVTVATIWNNLIAAGVVFILSLIPNAKSPVPGAVASHARGSS